ncbi:MAG: biotin--[acetyl-CoA-carboxylase] ligase [Oscillospiraceae bacterium]|nr:biotin--[acetyl-CoA-carboxylase] ligase [Oscillospiraceae bacterium]
MTVRERTAEVLEDNRGKYISGADIASELGVTRNAVWKAVNILKSEGYEINAVTNRGYCLSEDSDILSEKTLRKYLEPRYAANLRVYRRITSTNTVLKEMAAKGAPEGTILVAAKQTSGRGRFDRPFISGTSGVYFSILLRPDNIPAERSLLITTAAAVAVAQTVEKISGRSAGIKWVNDVFIGGKKICGILTEASFGVDGGGLDYAVLGIGVNVTEPEEGFPDEIKDIAGSVFEDGARVPDARSRIAAGIINTFFDFYLHPDKTDFIGEYKRRSIVIGKDVYLINGNNTEEARVTDIDSECRLIVRTKDGTEKRVSSGEISLKLK